MPCHAAVPTLPPRVGGDIVHSGWNPLAVSETWAVSGLDVFRGSCRLLVLSALCTTPEECLLLRIKRHGRLLTTLNIDHLRVAACTLGVPVRLGRSFPPLASALQTVVAFREEWAPLGMADAMALDRECG